MEMAAVSERTSPTNEIPNYRQQVRRALPDHLFKPDLSLLWWFPVHIAVIGGCYGLLATQFTWWLAPICALAIGHSFGCMGFIAHDIAHGASVRNPHLRDWLAGIGFSPFAIGPLLWRKWHNAEHHNNTNIEGEDPDHLFTIENYHKSPVLRLLYRISPLLRNLIIFGSFTFRMDQQMGLMLIAQWRKCRPRDRAIMLAQVIAPLAFWCALTLSLGTQVFWWGYVVPLMVGNAMVISYIVTNHFLNPLADERDVLATSLTVTLPKGLGWLDAWHNHFGAHVAHHLFPNAPAKSGRIIEAKVQELFPDRYHSMTITRALYLLWKTPWVYEDHDTLIDPQRQVRSKTLGKGLKP